MSRNNSIDERFESALKEEPGFQLDDRFSDRVVRKIRKQDAAEEKLKVLVYTLSLLGFLFISIFCLFIYADTRILSLLLDYSSWIILCAALIAVIQLLDQTLIRNKSRGFSQI